MVILDERCFVDVDPRQFDTAIVNMTVNARDAMDGEGRLTVTMRGVSTIPADHAHPATPGNFVAVAISDTGTGIDAESPGVNRAGSTRVAFAQVVAKRTNPDHSRRVLC